MKKKTIDPQSEEFKALDQRDRERLQLVQKRVINNYKQLEFWERVHNQEVDNEMLIASKTQAVVNALKDRQEYLNNRLEGMAKTLKVKLSTASAVDETLGEVNRGEVVCLYDEKIGANVILLETVIEGLDDKSYGKLAKELVTRGLGLSYIPPLKALVVEGGGIKDKVVEVAKGFKESLDKKKQIVYDEVPEGFTSLSDM